MIRLTRAVGIAVRWVAKTPRRVIAALVLPVLIGVAVAAPQLRRDDTPAGALAGQAGSPTPIPTTTETELPATTGPAPPAAGPPRTQPALAKAQVDVAARYVVTANSHDARPGKDSTFIDSYRRTRSYVTPSLLAQITAPSRRGDYLWGQWARQQARVTAAVLGVAVPDGAPLPTATTAYVRVQFRQVVTPTVAGGQAETTSSSISLIVTKGQGGTWLVSRLLPDT
jgi:hypothetical protein